MTPQEGLRWIQAAQGDLNAARSLLEDGYYHLCAFHAQQAAEKGLKGLLRLHGAIPWGHSCFSLLTQLDSMLADTLISPDLFEAVQRLDRHYISARYPDAFSTGVPADYYDDATAMQAAEDARAILAFIQGQVP
jgi:HEPN domain-containing protein